jgi:putative addiction module killer protein
MIEIRRTMLFTHWVRGLSDGKARAKVFSRIDRLRDGNLGDVKPTGDGLSEMRITHGPGYRSYYALRGAEIVILLCGGDKS